MRQMTESQYQQFLGKAADALNGGINAWRVQSTGEQCAVALVLNQPQWLEEIGYTIAQAIHRAGPEWCSVMIEIERELAAWPRQTPTDNDDD